MAERSEFRGNFAASSMHEHSRPGMGGEHEARERERRREQDQGTQRAEQPPAFTAESVEQLVERYPYASLLTSVGLGFGLGLALALLVPRRQPSWYEPYVPESMQHLPEQLKWVPETVASYLPRRWRQS
jgi:hypothetical protein